MPTLLGQIGDRARNPKCNKTAAFSCGANVRDEGEPRLVRVYTKLGDREHIFCHDTSSFDLVSPAHVRSRPNSTNHPRGICKHKNLRCVVSGATEAHVPRTRLNAGGRRFYIPMISCVLRRLTVCASKPESVLPLQGVFVVR